MNTWGCSQMQINQPSGSMVQIHQFTTSEEIYIYNIYVIYNIYIKYMYLTSFTVTYLELFSESNLSLTKNPS